MPREARPTGEKTRAATALAKDALTYTALLFSLSAYLLLCLGAFGEPPAPGTPGVVDKADGWPESKARHMEEGDFWHKVEQAFADRHDPSSWSGWLFVSAMGTDAQAREVRAQTGALDEFHEFEMFVWCLAVPILAFGLLGLGIAAWIRPAREVTRATWVGTAALAVVAASVPSERLYHVLWDLSIHLSNLVGATYYDFTVWFFVYLPALAMGLGTSLLGAYALAGDRQLPHGGS